MADSSDECYVDLSAAMDAAINKMWQSYDPNNNGFLNRDEARELLISTLKEMDVPGDLLSDDAFDAIFNEFDTDANGTISKDAIVAFFSTFMDFAHNDPFAFAPSHVVVPIGSTVTWVHANPLAPLHSITSVDGSADSPELALGHSFHRVFHAAGTFHYYCYRYSFMEASVTVVDAAPRVPTPPPMMLATSEPKLMTTHDAFVHAASLNQTTVLARWIEKGLAVDADDSEGQKALCMAARHQSLDAMQLLLAHGASVHATQSSGGQTALHCACTWGRQLAVELLLTHGARVDSCDASKQTPLHCASRNGHVDVVLCLLRAGADPHVADELGHTPLQVATDWKRLDVLEALTHYVSTTYRTAMARKLELAMAYVRYELPRGVRDTVSDEKRTIDALTSLDVASAPPLSVLQHASVFSTCDIPPSLSLDDALHLLHTSQSLVRWLLNDRQHLRSCNKRLKQQLEASTSSAAIVRRQSAPNFMATSSAAKVAVVRVQTLVRGFLARRRFQKLLIALFTAPRT
ncbi:hypothetical protein SDRG_00825 [Saprolegnia diclina VS20]|uniref:EF-hand domain-containing protein n=1 Tax=Saprolegnia diclina (strain VS20) TaxID=1156394 RepID=T0R4V6_SAPDV|nr:hypothetical protein SDRG_00825 [Saprolegnia diclina VS20]EQC41976.1 hypothetical protein SDRG_00825 [Saprolegnia diclina VS20]|eukprot:XP_008604545.1 hypothetical protein SDRG_00825 [Saprolegnia diclina VS20]